jgi:hypothetical protein
MRNGIIDCVLLRKLKHNQRQIGINISQIGLIKNPTITTSIQFWLAQCVEFNEENKIYRTAIQQKIVVCELLTNDNKVNGKFYCEQIRIG